MPAPHGGNLARGGERGLSAHTPVGRGAHLLTEEPEAVGVAEVLPGVEHLDGGTGDREWPGWSHASLAPTPPRLLGSDKTRPGGGQ